MTRTRNPDSEKITSHGKYKILITGKFSLILSVFLAASAGAYAQSAANSDLLLRWMQERPRFFSGVLRGVDTNELQILYTQIDRDRQNRPSFRTFSFRVDAGKYFYPASFVKLPVAALTLEKIRRLSIPGLAQARMENQGQIDCKVERMNFRTRSAPSLQQYLKRMLLVSDNEAYNALYDFLGADFINDRLAELGYNGARIFQRAGECSPDQNLVTNPIAFYDERKRVILEQPMLHSRQNYMNPLGHIVRGRAHIENDVQIDGGQDFSYRNRLSLEDIHSILMSIIFPEATPGRRFNLPAEDFAYLRRLIGMSPRESPDPAYRLPDNFANFLLFSRQVRRIPPNIRSFNVVARAFGYIGDSAYIVDYNKKIEFFVSAVLYVNEDGVMGDDVYDYDRIGMPFLAELGRLVYEKESQRRRTVRPDLRNFVIR